MILIYSDPARKHLVIQAIRDALLIWKGDHPAFQHLPVILGGDLNFTAVGAPRYGYREPNDEENEQLNENFSAIADLLAVQEVFPQPMVPTWKAYQHA